jgi:hypothetical protein
LASVIALQEQALIILSDSEKQVDNKYNFCFELAWLKNEGLFEMVAQEWDSVPNGPSPMEMWQNKITHLRKSRNVYL